MGSTFAYNKHIETFKGGPIFASKHIETFKRGPIFAYKHIETYKGVQHLHLNI